ncbi:MAG: cysteine--tRNA ligase [Candidatus Omnitrophica bacterium]|nr:cysteine--tRNA ligase [Candidatus Omnitrophota bacterium]
MSLKIYNSLTQKKEEFIPLAAGRVSMYVCGPTVYDVSHIGHLRAAFVFDVIRRYLEFSGLKVTFVRNVTDIDDKIINRARRELPGAGMDLKQKAREIAEKYTRLYEDDMAHFGIKTPDIQPKATEHIPDMIALINRLIERGIAYVSDGDVYFSVRKFPGYGKLSHQSVDQMLEGVRKTQEGSKNDPLDFALWKKAKAEEPSWKSPWGEGRPGWHIECSAMSGRYLGGTFDIHGGGRDLIFPHHENEIAQAEAATDQAFARVWIHNGLLTVEKEKMAKSLGNFVTIEDILKTYHPDAVKIFFLQAHYSSSIDFSREKMDEAKKGYERFEIFFHRVQEVCGSDGGSAGEISRDPGAGEALNGEKFFEAMNDDFNTALALAKLFDMVSAGNCIIDDQNIPREQKKPLLFEVQRRIKELGGILGLFQQKPKELGISEQLINEKINRRLDYKKQKNFSAADAIRKELLELGVVLEDTKDGKTSWRIVT